MPTGNETIRWIPYNEVPADKKVTYARLVASLRPHKTERHRVRVTVGGDKLPFDGDASTKTASLTTTKILLNSTISTPGARFMTSDIKDFYYGNPLGKPEYMRILLADIPEEIITQYDLRAIAHAGYVYMEINKGMPGLKQAGRVANDRLRKHLAPYGYAPVPRTPALWAHETRKTMFALVVDDFGIQYQSQADADHLLNALRDLYQITSDPSGELFCGLAIKWNYAAK